jgi:hypothetical protein
MAPMLWNCSYGRAGSAGPHASRLMGRVAFDSTGIYFIPAPGADGKSSIQFLSFATATTRTVAPLSGPPGEGLCVSPDGRSILFSQRDEAGSDLMLAENFR